MTQNPFPQYRKLGNTDISVTTLGLGGAWLGYSTRIHRRDHEVGAATVLRALQLGIRLIDTSGSYGDSEIIIGKALNEWFRNGGKRGELVITTKTGTRTNPRNYSAEATVRSVEQSLLSMGLDYIDVLMVHDPESLEPVFAEDGALIALERLRQQGWIKAIGLGVRDHLFHQHCIQSGRFDMSLTYGDYNLLNQTAVQDIMPYAETHRTGILNAMVVEYGLLSGRDPLLVAAERDHRVDPVKLEKSRKLWEFAQSRNIDLLALALQFSIRDPRVNATLVGAASPAEIEDDVKAFQQHISPAVWQALYDEFHL